MSIWFDGPVAQAVGAANSKQCLLLVCLLQGNDEASTQYEARFSSEPLATELASLDLVALKLTKESQDGALFGQIYPIMSLPAVYLIRNGLLADFLPAQVEPAQMLERIQKAVQGHFAIPPPPGVLSSTNANASSSSATPPPPSPAAAAATPTPHAPVAAAASPTTSTTTTTTSTTTTSTSHQESVQKLKQLQEERRIQREKEEREAAKKRELDRRANSKLMQEAQTELKEKEAKKIKEQLEREKREEAEYRKRLKQQLEEDKQRRKAEREKEREQLEAAKRAAALAATGASETTTHEDSSPEVVTPSEVRQQNSGLWNARNDASSSLSCATTRLNVRLFDGSSIRNVFQATDTLSVVREWIDQNRGEDDTPYNIVQVIPPRMFADEDKTLRDLDLCPSATLVLKPIVRSTDAYGGSGSGVVSSVMGLGWSAWNLAGKAASAAYSTVSYYNPLSGSEGSSSSNVHGSPSSSSSARAKKDDSDRDPRRNTTYNGNSTSLE
ncbi:hypothetical protein BGZ73_008525 [Actinomortierella ambigua]|nr:hypothetical protein BGZ73_008525 [Actinomortierella ambigua]